MNTLKFGNGEWYGKKDTILAYNDENSNYKPLPFNFSRASKATVINKAGLIETVGSGIPRIDYLGNTKGALKLEPQRTNLITKSENIQDWNKASNATAEFGYQDPFKGNKAVKLTSSSTAQGYQVYQSTSALSSGNTYTFSIYAKKGTSYIFRLDFGIPDNGFVHIDLRDGSLLQESGSTYYDGYKVEPMSNDWYRISIISTFNSSAYYRAGLYQQQGDCYVAFAQIEQGSYPTSYIPTQGTIQTRLQDNIDTDFGTILPLSGEVSVYMEMLGQPVDGIANAARITSVSFDDTDVNSSYVSLNFNGSYWRARVQGASGSNFNSLEVDQSETIKALFVLRPTSYALYANGNLIGSETRSYNVTAPTISEIAKVEFDNSTSDRGITRNKDLRVYNTALSNAEAIALTQV